MLFLPKEKIKNLREKKTKKLTFVESSSDLKDEIFFIL